MLFILYDNDGFSGYPTWLVTFSWLKSGYAGPQGMFVMLVCWLEILAKLPGGKSGWLTMLSWI
jgi:hypothetical protein